MNLIKRTSTLLFLWLAAALALSAQQPLHKLFSDEMRSLQPSPIYDFVEQALADHQTRQPDRQYQLSKITFSRGSWATLMTVGPADDCAIDNLEGRRYVITWTRDGRTLVQMHFPIDYELLANNSRRQLERQLVAQLRNFTAAPRQSLPLPAQERLERYPTDEPVFLCKGPSFSLLPAASRNTYFTLKTIKETAKEGAFNYTYTYEDVVPAILSDPAHPRETLANWVLFPDQSLPRPQVAVDVLMSDYSREQLSVSLDQLVQYCEQQGCTTYYAFEAVYGKEVAAMLLFDCPQSGYAHMVYLTCPSAQLSKSKPQLKGRAYLYIPFANVKDIFARNPKGQSNPKKYE